MFLHCTLPIRKKFNCKWKGFDYARSLNERNICRRNLLKGATCNFAFEREEKKFAFRRKRDRCAIRTFYELPKVYERRCLRIARRILYCKNDTQCVKQIVHDDRKKGNVVQEIKSYRWNKVRANHARWYSVACVTRSKVPKTRRVSLVREMQNIFV